VYEESRECRKALLGDGGGASGFDHLEAVRDRLAELAEWTVPELERVVKEYADHHVAGKLGKVAQPLRIAVCGCLVSPPIFHTLAILGRTSTLKRIDGCLARREALTGA
jgi:glutamyl-tRNA synthetase